LDFEDGFGEVERDFTEDVIFNVRVNKSKYFEFFKAEFGEEILFFRKLTSLTEIAPLVFVETSELLFDILSE
jgi:hypothetical protein